MGSKRILISYFFGKSTIPLGYSLTRAFTGLGYEVSCFDSAIRHPVDTFFFKPVNKLLWNFRLKHIDISRGSKWNNQGHRDHLLELEIKTFCPAIVLILRGHGYDKDFLAYLKKKYSISKLVGWWVKGPQWLNLLQDDSTRYDYYFCIHSEHNVKKVKRLNAIGVDDKLYRKISQLEINKKPYAKEVVFVGGWSIRRQNILREVSNFPISIWGDNWRKKNIFTPLAGKIMGSGIYGESLVKLYNASKIVLNISNWDPTASGVNLRIFDVPACGSFFLTEHSPELTQYFKIGVEIESFKDNDELKDKLSFYLKNDTVRDKIAQAGYGKVKKFQNYKQKMSLFLKEIGIADHNRQ